MSKNNQNTKTEETVVEKTAEQINAERGTQVTNLMKTHENVKAKVIRAMAASGLKVGEINKAFEVAGVKMRYQHVRNVLNQPTKTKKA